MGNKFGRTRCEESSEGDFKNTSRVKSINEDCKDKKETDCLVEDRKVRMPKQGFRGLDISQGTMLSPLKAFLHTLSLLEPLKQPHFSDEATEA